ncbi:Thrombospondin type-1 domain-containing protein 4 [Chionoecetes opilio]|uniref:Thrombospondin type-1 domain-containing protein 4 n=1 Tax=Chionoecetes opilio TaxID=41210 RepID=A0A8J4Y7H6_CHIOP|nr:Thrombospondin type-1 domain-containing protein 4 [Chionoecetes opilio]
MITPLPAGVCNLTISEMKPSKNYFALRRSDGTYILNGNWDIKTAGEYEAGGTTFIYTPGSEERGERLSAPGPLREPVDFMLISQSPNPGIEYEYRIPLPDYGSGNPSGAGLSSGSRAGLRGRGVPSVPVGSIGHNTGLRRPFQGSTSLSSGSPNYGTRNPGQRAVIRLGPGTAGLPSDSFMPLTPVLQPMVGVGPSPGFNSSNVPLYPIKTQRGMSVSPAGTPRRWPPYLGVPQGPLVDTGSRTTARLPGVIPRGQPITPLSTLRKGPLPRPWSPGFNPQGTGRGSAILGSPFQQGQPFSRSSGSSTASSGGVGSRFPGREEVVVSTEHGGRNGRLRPALTPTRDSELSVGGRQTLYKATNHQGGQSNKATTPASHRTRHQHGFQETQSRGKVPGKSSQSSAFNPDVQLTQPKASVQPTSNITDSNGASMNRDDGGDRHRHRHQQRTSKKRRKNRRRGQEGRFQWAEKGLTPCSRSCGGGNQTAILSCERKRNKKVMADRRCSRLPRPDARFVLCNLTPCPAEWMPGEWESCSVTCGMGVQTRPTVCKQVVSPTLTMMVVPEGACLSPPTIATSQVCTAGPCRGTNPTWEIGSWTNCSAPCGLGTRSRHVSCTIEGASVNDDLCSLDARPVREEVCDMGSCATNTWFFSAWSQQCSEPCGVGVKTRQVHCLAGDSQSSCATSQQPDASRPCTGQSGCGGQWFVGSWSDCSKPCGAGRETRPVLCIVLMQERWKVLEDSQCQASVRPQDNRECNPESCIPAWFTSDWSQCSASCGGGIMRREVTCLDHYFHASPDCDNTTKPDARRSCHLNACSDTAPRPTQAPAADDDPLHAAPTSPQPPFGSVFPVGEEGIEEEDEICIDRIKNCHLVFRARLCRLKYYNKLCCRTCNNT